MKTDGDSVNSMCTMLIHTNTHQSCVPKNAYILFWCTHTLVNVDAWQKMKKKASQKLLVYEFYGSVRAPEKLKYAE